MDCQIYNLLALRTLYTETQQYDQALQIQNQFFEHYHHGRAIFYSMASLLVNRAELYQKQGNLEHAAQDYQSAIQWNEQEFGLTSFGRVKSMAKLAEIYEQQGKTEAAVGLKEQINQAKEHQRSCTDNVDYAPFIAKLEKRIRWNWFPPQQPNSAQIIAVFRLMPDGNISHLRLTKLSPSLVANQKAIAAIQNSAPFMNVPSRCHDYAEVQFIFDYELRYF
jgi:tetratricopeptide (TPR) repeat protein